MILAMLLGGLAAVSQLTFFYLIAPTYLTLNSLLILVMIFFYLEQPAWAWAASLTGGVIFDLLSSYPPGVFTLVFVIIVSIAELTYELVGIISKINRLIIATFILSLSYQFITLTKLTYSPSTAWWPATLSAILSTLVLLLGLQVIKYFYPHE